MQINPFHTVPTLQEETFSLCDSHAINCYLVDKHRNDDELYPNNLQKRATINQRLHFDSNVLSPKLADISVSMSISYSENIQKLNFPKHWFEIRKKTNSIYRLECMLFYFFFVIAILFQKIFENRKLLNAVNVSLGN